MAHMLTVSRGIVVVAFAFMPLLSAAQVDEPVSSAVQTARVEGLKFEQRRQLTSAEESLQRALKLSGKKCFACFSDLVRVQMKMEHYPEAAATASQLAAAVEDPKEKARANFEQASALFTGYQAQAGNGEQAAAKPDKRAAGWLKDAESALNRAVAEDPGFGAAHMLHGRVLAILRRDEEASRAFAACAAAQGGSAEECVRAAHFAKDVSLARGTPAAPFSLKTLEGKAVSLDSLQGKVVLVDFWATWCPACRRDSDYVQSIADGADEDRFVLLEVDVDETEAAWLNYVKENRLGGVQTRDSTSAIREAFHVTAFPTYIILDGDGMTRMRVTGTRGDLRGMVRKLLAASPDTVRRGNDQPGAE